MTALGAHRYPFKLVCQRARALGLALFFNFEPALFLFQPARVIAFPGDAFAPVQLENPTGHIVQKIPVVRYRDDCARILAQVALEPGDRLRIQMVRGLVQEQNVGLLQKQPAKRNTAALPSGQRVHHLISRRTAQRFHGEVQPRIQIPGAKCIQLFLERRLFGREFVKIRIGISECFVDLVEFCQGIDHFLHALTHHLAHGLARFKVRLLLQKPNRVARCAGNFSGKLPVLSCDDAQERRLARAIKPDYADFCAVIIR